MRSIHAGRCALAVLVWLLPLTSAVCVASPPGLPSPEQRLQQILPPDGLPVFESIDSLITATTDLRVPRPLVHRRWDPRTGVVTERTLELTGFALATVRLPAGLLFAHLADPPAASGSSMRAVLLAPDGRLVQGATLVARTGATWVRLTDGSALLLGGRGDSARSRAVEWVRWRDGNVQVDRLPDHPGAGEAAFAAVGLADGRLLLTGGNDGIYRGCMPCTAETWLLDPARARWTRGACDASRARQPQCQPAAGRQRADRRRLDADRRLERRADPQQRALASGRAAVRSGATAAQWQCGPRRGAATG